MVERYRRGKNKQKLLGNHQKCWIWGRNTVCETFNVGRWPILELRLAETLDEIELKRAQQRADELDIPVLVESSERLTKLCQSKEHQGYLAKMTEYPYVEIEAAFENLSNNPVIAILDSIQDPHNFGAIIRSACLLGVEAIFVTRRNQVDVTSLVARSSAGAVNHLPIVQVDDLTELIMTFRDRGISSVAAKQESTEMITQQDLTRPTAIVIGNEGAGVRPEVIAACDVQVSIPQCGRFDSLNAAVAAGILFYEPHRQRIQATG